MSPSWISRLLPRTRAAGLMIGRREVSLAVIERGRAGTRVVDAASRALTAPLFGGSAGEAAASELSAALQALAGSVLDGYLPLHVSVPGPAVPVAVLGLEALPRKHAERVALARWHFAQNGKIEQDLVCDCEPLGSHGERHLLLAFAMEAAWHRCLADALGRAGLAPSSLNADVCRQFNRFHDRLLETGEGGALVVVARDAWSLLLWDGAGRVRHCSSRWRGAAADEALQVATEIERRIVAAVDSLTDLQVGRLFLLADDDGRELADAVDTRLRAPCVRLPAGLDDAHTPGAVVPAALAAALQS